MVRLWWWGTFNWRTTTQQNTKSWKMLRLCRNQKGLALARNYRHCSSLSYALFCHLHFNNGTACFCSVRRCYWNRLYRFIISYLARRWLRSNAFIPHLHALWASDRCGSAFPCDDCVVYFGYWRNNGKRGSSDQWRKPSWEKLQVTINRRYYQLNRRRNKSPTDIYVRVDTSLSVNSCIAGRL